MTEGQAIQEIDRLASFLSERWPNRAAPAASAGITPVDLAIEILKTVPSATDIQRCATCQAPATAKLIFERVGVVGQSGMRVSEFVCAVHADARQLEAIEKLYCVTVVPVTP